MNLRLYGDLLCFFYECYVEENIYENPLDEELKRYVFCNPTNPKQERCFRIHSIEDLVAITTMICKLVWLEYCDSGGYFEGFDEYTTVCKYNVLDRKVKGGKHNKRRPYEYRNKSINFHNLVKQLGLRYIPTDAEMFWYYGIFGQFDENGEKLYDLNNCEFDRLYLFDILTKDDEAILIQKLKDECPNFPYYEGRSYEGRRRPMPPFYFNNYLFFDDYEDRGHRAPSPEWFIKTLLETTSKSEPD